MRASGTAVRPDVAFDWKIVGAEVQLDTSFVSFAVRG